MENKKKICATIGWKVYRPPRAYRKRNRCEYRHQTRHFEYVSVQHIPTCTEHFARYWPPKRSSSCMDVFSRQVHQTNHPADEGPCSTQGWWSMNIRQQCRQNRLWTLAMVLPIGLACTDDGPVARGKNTKQWFEPMFGKSCQVKLKHISCLKSLVFSPDVLPS